MAEAEITIRDDEDILAEINKHGINCDPSHASRALPWLRARGSADSVLARARYPFENPLIFDYCQFCEKPLSGCVSSTSRAPREESWTLVMSCGHVLCEACKNECERTEQQPSDDPPLFRCLICREFGSVNRLPGSDAIKMKTCQASYCTGEQFAPPQERCVQCQRMLCESCVQQHHERYPEHDVITKPTNLVNALRAFTGCATHRAPVTSRCSCGEMVCSQCPYNYISRMPGSSDVVAHKKTRMEEVDLDLEDELEDTTALLSRIRDMRALANEKLQELEGVTDRLANEVALHFNQIIIQAIERCFDVLKGLKSIGSAHHAAIDGHIRMLSKTERQLIMGVEMDERARARTTVQAESVAQYVRNVSYGLCKPALKQFEESKKFSEHLESTAFSLDIPAPSTVHILDRIAHWGEQVHSNAIDTTAPPKEIHIKATRLVREISSTTDRTIRAAHIPLRLHSALEHFTDLYERRYFTDSQLMASELPPEHRRELPFQLGDRVPPEAMLSGEEAEARLAYERYMLSRPGMYLMQPKIFGGFRRIWNLQGEDANGKQLLVKDVAAAYERTPGMAPIWLGAGDDPTEITQRRASTAQENAHLRATRPTERSESPSIIDERPSTANGNSSDDHSPPGGAGVRMMQQQRPSAATAHKVPTVLRKKNLIFVKTGELPPVLQPEAELPPPLGAPAPSRALPPNILRRSAPLHVGLKPPGYPAKPATYFRPATNAERVAAGVAAGGAAAATPHPAKNSFLYRPGAPAPRRVIMPRSPHVNRLDARIDESKRPVTIRDSNGILRMASRHPQAGFPRPTPRLAGQPGAGPSPAYRTIASPAGGNLAARLRGEEADLGSGSERSPASKYRVVGTSENRFTLPVKRQRIYTPEEAARRTQLRSQGFTDDEIAPIMDKERADKQRQTNGNDLSNIRVIVPRISGTSKSAAKNEANAAGTQPATKKKMLSIEKAFTNMFGADGSLIPEISFRRRGRPSKDDPTAPSNIIQEFRKHAIQWPPKFDEMNETEVAELQELIDQLDAVTSDEAEREGSGVRQQCLNGFKSEEDEPPGSAGLVSPWQTYTHEEREQLKLIARQKIEGAGARIKTQGCFVCALFRQHNGRPRTWQCAECEQMGRALTPIRDDEVVEEVPAPAMKRSKTTMDEALHDYIDDGDDEDVMDEEQGGAEIDLTALFERPPSATALVSTRGERRGRPKKQKVPEEPAQATPKPRKRRAEQQPQPAAVAEPEPEPEEEVVMGTTRRGRQIKMPAKLKGHEVHTAATTKRASEGSESARRSASAETSFNLASILNASLTESSAASSARSSTSKKKNNYADRPIKEEEPDPDRLPRSAMDPPRRGGRRRNY